MTELLVSPVQLSSSPVLVIYAMSTVADPGLDDDLSINIGLHGFSCAAKQEGGRLRVGLSRMAPMGQVLKQRPHKQADNIDESRLIIGKGNRQPQGIISLHDIAIIGSLHYAHLAE
jgi:hypothetical protein